MKRLFFAGGTVFVIALFLLVSNFSINTDIENLTMRSIDSTDLPSKQKLILHETEIGNQYIKPLKKSIPNSQWEETHISSEATISGISVQKNISFEYYSEMPTPSQKVLDRASDKAKNPQPRKIPFMQDSENKISPLIDEAINIDDFLDKEKKNQK
jgi:hypothetical protein